MGKRLSVHISQSQATTRHYFRNWAETNEAPAGFESTKRLVDISLSLLFLLVIGWLLFPLLAIAIALDSKGPVLFRQVRNGHKGQQFVCLKFRTMKFRECKLEFKQASQNDDRITRIGRILRKTSLDELPQIFNVISGDMSLVGPRPHPVALDEQFAPKWDTYFERYDSKPGLTGLAQINGFRGATETDTDMRNRLRMDLLYVRNRNILLDIFIIAKSFLLIFRGDPNAF
jgi:lipopolysaccharide/colanic/teichoic acid biosynthesis glycosyltransferase